MARRQRFGIGDVESGATDDTFAEGGDEVVSDDVSAAGDVDQPGVVLHQGQLVGGDQTFRVWREREGDDDEVGSRQGVGIAVGVEHVVDARQILGAPTNHRDVTVERLQQADQRRGDATSAEDRDPTTEQVAALRRLP